MANVRERTSRGKRVFCAQVRVAGFKAESRTFPSRKLALEWATKRETELKYGITDLTNNTVTLPSLKTLADRYEREITLSQWETNLKRSLCRQPLTNKPIDAVSTLDVAEFRDAFLLRVKPTSLQKYIRFLRKVMKRARSKWGYPKLPDIFEDIGLKSTEKPRERTITKDELNTIREYLLSPKYRVSRGTSGQHFLYLIEFALTTAMREGEISRAKIDHLSHDGMYLYVPKTKTDTPRWVPLSPKARQIIKELTAGGYVKEGRLFPCSAKAISKRFTGMCKVLKIVGLHFHDLRHSALSYYDQQGFSKGDLKNIGGHKTDKMLFRYLHADLSNTLGRMDRLGC